MSYTPTRFNLSYQANLATKTLVDPGNGNAIGASESGHLPIVTAGVETRTLADAAEAGLILDLYLKTDGGDCVVTTASPVNQTGNNTLTFATITINSICKRNFNA